jgi:hypothetical protein
MATSCHTLIIESIQNCKHKGWGRINTKTKAGGDCKRIFIDCNPKNQSPPFIATSDIGQTRFGILAMKLRAGDCHFFCFKYGGTAAVVYTEQKYETVHKMIKQTDEELSGIGGYAIGLYQRKLMLGMNLLD